MNELTLIVTYRKRPKFLNVFLEQWTSYYSKFCNLIFIESADKPSKIAFSNAENTIYQFIQSESEIFHKSKLINIALEKVKTKYFIVYDIDTVSYDNALERHLKLSKIILPNIIVGYRLNISQKKFKQGINDIKTASVSSENKPSALLKYLLHNERFGINPIYQTQLAKKIKGFDEQFLGWGCEDQDFLERYLDFNKITLLQSYDLLYFHINHKHETHWKNDKIVNLNRNYYYKKKKHDQ